MFTLSHKNLLFSNTFKIYISRPRKKELASYEVKPKAKALRHFKVEAVYKFDDSGLSLSQWAKTLIF